MSGFVAKKKRVNQSGVAGRKNHSIAGRVFFRTLHISVLIVCIFIAYFITVVIAGTVGVSLEFAFIDALAVASMKALILPSQAFRLELASDWNMLIPGTLQGWAMGYALLFFFLFLLGLVLSVLIECIRQLALLLMPAHHR